MGLRARPLAGHTSEDFTLLSQYPTQPRGAALFEPRRMGMSYTAWQEGKRIMGRNDRIRPDPVADRRHPVRRARMPPASSRLDQASNKS